jgi:hypothetical protein
MLIGRHESNQPTNNHNKESYKILWKNVFEALAWGQSRYFERLLSSTKRRRRYG